MASQGGEGINYKAASQEDDNVKADPRKEVEERSVLSSSTEEDVPSEEVEDARDADKIMWETICNVRLSSGRGRCSVVSQH